MDGWMDGIDTYALVPSTIFVFMIRYLSMVRIRTSWFAGTELGIKLKLG